MFWKRTTADAALAVVILSIPLSLGMKLGFPEVPFLDRMGITFLLCAAALILISLMTRQDEKVTATTNSGASGKWGLAVAMAVIGGATAIKILVEGVLPVDIAIGTLVLLAVGLVLLLRGKETADPKPFSSPMGCVSHQHGF